MAIKLGEKDLFPYLGDYGPVSIYKGEQKLAGYKWAEKSGQELHFDNTYNSHVEVEVDGQSYQEQSKDLLDGITLIENTVINSSSAYTGVASSAKFFITEPIDLTGVKSVKATHTPSPDYPSDIYSLNDFDVVSSVGGRNLIDSNSILQGDGTTEHLKGLSAWALPLLGSAWVMENLKRNTSYQIQYEVVMRKPVGTTNPQAHGQISLYNPSNYGFINIGRVPREEYQALREGDSYKVVSSFTTPDDLDGFHIILYTSYTEDYKEISEIDLKNLSITEGNIFPYSPAPEDITPDTDHPLIDKINLNLSEPLRSVGDVKDRLFKDSDGLWKVERNVKEHIFTGSEPIGPDPTYGVYYSSGDSLRDQNIIGVSSNCLKSSTGLALLNGEKNAIGLNNTGAIRMSIVVDGVQHTTSTVRPWLTQKYDSGNPFIIQYLVETPTIETLDQDLQDKLNTLKSFKGSNYVYTVLQDDDLTPTIHAKTEVKDI